MRRIFTLGFALFTMFTCGAGAQSAPTVSYPPVLVVTFYARVAPANVSPEGFVDGSDKVLVDSVADLFKALDGQNFHPDRGYPGTPSHYVAVSDPAKADIIVTVAARGISTASLGARTTMQVYNGVVIADTVPTVGVTRWVSMVLSVGTYRKEFVAWSTNQSRFSVGAWTGDAKRLALMAAAWVMANEAQIRKRQIERAKG